MATTKSLAATKKLASRPRWQGLSNGVGGEQRLTQALLRLVGNAIKFTDVGEVRFTAAAENGHVALSVSDSGPGIPLQERDRFLEKFGRVDSSNNARQGRHGAGCCRRKRDCRDADKRIWVEWTRSPFASCGLLGGFGTPLLRVSPDVEGSRQREFLSNWNKADHRAFAVCGKLLVRSPIHCGRRSDIQRAHFLNARGVVETEPVRHTRAAVISRD
jgi:hypothetical protein